jgi:hypothetical protein
MTISKGDYVRILPEFQDQGDDEFDRVVVEGEEKGRITVATLGTGMRIAPTSVLRVEWVRVVPAPTNASKS